MNNQTISYEECLFTITHPDIYIERNSMMTTQSLILLLLSSSLFCIAFCFHKSNPTFSLFLFTAGGCGSIWAIHSLFHKNRRKKYRPTGSEMRECALFFENEYKSTLLTLLRTGDFRNKNNLTNCINGGIRMDIIYSVDGRFAAAQLMEFEPYSFYPASPIFYYREPQATDLGQFAMQFKQ